MTWWLIKRRVKFVFVQSVFSVFATILTSLYSVFRLIACIAFDWIELIFFEAHFFWSSLFWVISFISNIIVLYGLPISFNIFVGLWHFSLYYFETSRFLLIPCFLPKISLKYIFIFLLVLCILSYPITRLFLLFIKHLLFSFWVLLYF